MTRDDRWLHAAMIASWGRSGGARDYAATAALRPTALFSPGVGNLRSNCGS